MQGGSLTNRPVDRTATVLATLAALVGVASAGVSAYWAAGGTGLLDTVGGVFERAGRSGSARVQALMGMVVVVKLVAVGLPWSVLRLEGSWRRAVTALGWAEAFVLTGYGLVLTGAGLLVQADVIRSAPDADQRALVWHAYVWDPWFLVWGLLVVATLYAGQRGVRK